jgi:hypothetical protein
MTGVPLIKWGTDGMFGSYILKDVTATDDAEEITVENGGGLKSWRIILAQGRTYDLTCVDDGNIAAPNINTTIAIVDQLGRGNITARVVGVNGRAARKVEADVIIRAEFLTNIEGGGNVPANF